MSTELTCPDCGGIIGGDPSQGKVCTCFGSSGSAKKIDELESPASLETSSDVSSDTSVVDEPAPTAKVCCQCGKDLVGKRRLRDSRGYWCYACHKLDQEQNKIEGVRCADCGRVVPESALTEYDGARICALCRADRKEADREKMRMAPIDSKAYQELDKKRLIWLAGVLAVLLLIIIIHWL